MRLDADGPNSHDFYLNLQSFGAKLNATVGTLEFDANGVIFELVGVIRMRVLGKT